ncbi:MAG: hypothetical protein EOO15_13415 [Chitinophagaceae bacterium]|nr:MAG: hypothetical protein EOO15_13415 [Chitinophagaceae bacterium]
MHPILAKLQQASEGLLAISESEAPFTAFQLNNDDDIIAALRILAGQPPNAPVEIQDAFAFLQKQERMYEGQPSGERFRDLTLLVRQLLPDAQLHRLGSIRIDAFLLGSLPDGTHGGLRTLLIET